MALDHLSAETAAAFVHARRSGVAMHHFPGHRPRDLASAYRTQDEAIDLWGEPVGGWKVGRIAPAWCASLESGDRLVGPIFSNQIRHASDQSVTAPVFTGGFAAVEGEFVLVLASDAPSSKLDWSDDDLVALIAAVHVGIEIASSPYPDINADGPLVTIADFGNNAGLLLGAEFPNWRAFKLTEWTVLTRIDGESVGSGDASAMPGGPLESLRAALTICASRGRPLRRGMAISTGAISGVHEARIGQGAEVTFGNKIALRCRLAASDGSASDSLQE